MRGKFLLVRQRRAKSELREDSYGKKALFGSANSLSLCGVRATWRQVIPAGGLFLAGVALALALVFVSVRWEREKADALFSLEGERQLQSLIRSVDSFQADNNAIKSFMQLNPNATYSEFKYFARKQLAPAVRQNTVITLGYVPAVSNEEREGFEREACDVFCEAVGRNYSNFFIRNTSLPYAEEKAKERYFPVFYAFPFEVSRPPAACCFLPPKHTPALPAQPFSAHREMHGLLRPVWMRRIAGKQGGASL
mmetsp:Transcript_35665/g.84512  ORF Transcript_35665/g.84512 Transcript_35665/m.84512 type:complete len:252 (-) Transcript_35665:468-1223(-)